MKHSWIYYNKHSRNYISEHIISFRFCETCNLKETYIPGKLNNGWVGVDVITSFNNYYESPSCNFVKMEDALS